MLLLSVSVLYLRQGYSLKQYESRGKQAKKKKINLHAQLPKKIKHLVNAKFIRQISGQFSKMLTVPTP